MASPSIEVRNLPDVIRALYELRTAVQAGQLGKVYSKGANQGSGNYEHWVQSEERQVWYHARTGWRTDEEVVKHFEGEVDRIFKSVAGAGDKVLDVLKKFTVKLLDEIYEYWSWYPPEPPQSIYLRTRTLYEAWDIEVSI